MRMIGILLALAVATLLTVMLLRPGAGPGDTPESEPVSREDAARAQPEPGSEQPEREVADRDRTPGPEDGQADEIEAEGADEAAVGEPSEVGRAFRSSEDYFAFVESFAEQGREGDGAAQYYVYRALNECSMALEQFDEMPDQFDLEAQMAPGVRPQVHQMMGEQIQRCEGFFEEGMDDYGDPREWLNGAALDGYPAAVVVHDMEEYRQHQAGRESDFNQARVVNALRSRNPEALSNFSQVAAIEGASETDEAAWLLMACDHGQDCGEDAEWVEAMCAEHGCPPDVDGAEDALASRFGPGSIDRARERQQELEEALNDGNFEALLR